VLPQKVSAENPRFKTGTSTTPTADHVTTTNKSVTARQTLQKNTHKQSTSHHCLTFPARLTCTVFDEVIFSAIAPQFPLVLVVTAACRELKAVRTPVRRSGRAISTFTRSVSAGAWARHQARLTLVNY